MGARRQLEIPELQNAAMSLCKKRLDNKLRAVPTADTVNFVYTDTRLGSPLRRLVVDVWMRRATMQWYLVRKDELPREFLEDLCGKLIGRIESMGISEFGLPDSEECYYVRPSLPRHSNEEEPCSWAREDVDVPQLATPAQMQNRKFKRPSSRIHRSSRPSSLGDMTQASAAVDGKRKDIITDEMTHLKI
ncbi:hypothetical protein CNMCM5793_000681 [Aspergillus hiratsukae]|uniref:Uncharacterized protein n=1 Tax=Aspergillus hiratsukae TaxID=1194566 RepID=A0A8H6ULM5_9EURO|nr:hypothetical protein CNMCM5793_000681 [Aspergillus hiratsukae]KAF7159433.1 hypothetical protein CNMCM6106_006706 [Aspergillus hiratsukae]